MKLDAKKNLNTLNKIKNAEIIKYKKRTTTQKELLNLFNGLEIFLTDNENENENENDNDNDNDKDNDSENDNENENDN